MAATRRASPGASARVSCPRCCRWEGVELSDQDIDDIVAYLLDRAGRLTLEERVRAARNRPKGPPAGIVRTVVEDFRVETVVRVGPPYAFDFLPDGTILITETAGALRVVSGGKLLPEPIAGAPSGDISGMTQWFRRANLSIAVHPDYSNNGWIYLMTARAASKPGQDALPISVTIHRGRLADGRWTDNETVIEFAAKSTDSLRMKFDAKGYLYVRHAWLQRGLHRIRRDRAGSGPGKAGRQDPAYRGRRYGSRGQSLCRDIRRLSLRLELRPSRTVGPDVRWRRGIVERGGWAARRRRAQPCSQGAQLRLARDHLGSSLRRRPGTVPHCPPGHGAAGRELGAISRSIRCRMV